MHEMQELMRKTFRLVLCNCFSGFAIDTSVAPYLQTGNSNSLELSVYRPTAFISIVVAFNDGHMRL